MTTQPTRDRARTEMGGDWRHRAVCRDVDPEIFFPAAQAGPVHDRQIAAAKAVCAGCPVRPECLTFALTGLPEGIAGGLTPSERRTHRTRSSRHRARRAGRRLARTDRDVAAVSAVAEPGGVAS